MMGGEQNQGNRKNLKILNVFFVKFFNLIFLLIFSFVGYFVFSFAVQPKFDAVKNQSIIKAERQNKEKDLLLAYLRELNKYNASFSNVDENAISKIDRMFPNGNDSEDLLVLMEDFVAEGSFILDSLSVKNYEGNVARPGEIQIKKKVEDSGNGEKVLEIDITILAVSYDDMKKIVERIENNLRIMDIESIDFSESNSSLKMKIKTYYF